MGTFHTLEVVSRYRDPKEGLTMRVLKVDNYFVISQAMKKHQAILPNN